MAESRFLIVNADDLGLTPEVNAGIFEAHEHGVVTSTSLMVERPAAIVAAEALAEYPNLAVGLHLEPEDCRAQLERFRELVGRDPTHLDSHKHVHEAEPVSAVAEALAVELGVPLRNRAVRYEGSFYGRPAGKPAPEAISSEHLIELIRSLPPGWTEIGCHPAAGSVPSSYDAERQIELRTLIDPHVKNLLNVSDVRLCSFAQVGER
ncbi:MAG TPA: ChbG/HpnK family deacetylase [Solirubrobacterales bacterium]|nr:ChbG/HpnK family deacetylase [Solirubrobacterales bacterium]